MVKPPMTLPYILSFKNWPQSFSPPPHPNVKSFHITRDPVLLQPNPVRPHLNSSSRAQFSSVPLLSQSFYDPILLWPTQKLATIGLSFSWPHTPSPARVHPLQSCSTSSVSGQSSSSHPRPNPSRAQSTTAPTPPSPSQAQTLHFPTLDQVLIELITSVSPQTKSLLDPILHSHRFHLRWC